MPKDGIKKLGNLKFDRKNPKLNLPAPRDEEEKIENRSWELDFKIYTLFDLMVHFGIDPKAENAWVLLAFHLAEHYVPAMQASGKVGQPRKWDRTAGLTLYALFKSLQHAHPNLKRQAIFEMLPNAAQKTSLRHLLKPHIKPITLEARYDKLNQDKYFMAFKAQALKEFSEEEFNEVLIRLYLKN
ncbi:MAG: hypothetical protein V4621_02715 [Pseudomonadota bacterium]